WKTAGAISYYGYAFYNGKSCPVGNDYAREMEDSLITNLLYDLDSTGIAHLANNFLPQAEEAKSSHSGGLSIPVPEVGYNKIIYTEEYPKIIADFYFQHFHDIHYR